METQKQNQLETLLKHPDYKIIKEVIKNWESKIIHAGVRKKVDVIPADLINSKNEFLLRFIVEININRFPVENIHIKIGKWHPTFFCDMDSDYFNPKADAHALTVLLEKMDADFHVKWNEEITNYYKEKYPDDFWQI
ncbi:MAG: hypothetical protein ACHQK8_03040 [Bacteroidia bacterium]